MELRHQVPETVAIKLGQVLVVHSLEREPMGWQLRLETKGDSDGLETIGVLNVGGMKTTGAATGGVDTSGNRGKGSGHHQG